MTKHCHPKHCPPLYITTPNGKHRWVWWRKGWDGYKLVTGGNATPREAAKTFVDVFKLVQGGVLRDVLFEIRRPEGQTVALVQMRGTIFIQLEGHARLSNKCFVFLQAVITEWEKQLRAVFSSIKEPK